jgi:hypothetical protein
MQLRPQAPYELPGIGHGSLLRLTDSPTEGMRGNRLTINATCETVDIPASFVNAYEDA